MKATERSENIRDSVLSFLERQAKKDSRVKQLVENMERACDE